MTRMDDNSVYVNRWTNAKLMREARKYANLETLEIGFNEIPATYHVGWHEQANKDQPEVADFVREQSKIYRESWLNPILDEIERRFVKVKP